MTNNKGTVYVRDNKIYLHGYWDGKRERLSTGIDATRNMIRWYERNFDIEFEKLCVKKYGKSNAHDMTFREYGEIILEITKGNRTESSQHDLEAIFRNLCIFFGDMFLTEIKPSDIMRWQSESNLASKTIVNHRSCINMVLESAYNDELISRNPLRAVRAPKITNTREHIYYTERDMQKILHASSGKWRNMFQFMFFTGVRAGELIGLKWSDVDLDNGIMTLCRNVRDGIEKESLKTQDERVIPLFKQAKDALRSQMLHTKMKSEYVFVNQYGQRYNRSDKILAKFKQVCKTAGVPVGTLHDIRRSTNTMLKQYGFKSDFILDFMGHNEEYVNRKHYTGKILDDLSKLDAISV